MFKNYTVFTIYSIVSTLLISVGIYFLGFVEIKTTSYFILFTVTIFTINLTTLLLLRYYSLHYFKDPGFKKEQELITLKTSEKYRREFVGNVSHELKTPIFNIQGYVETLIGGALYDKTVNKKYLKRTSKSVDRLIYIIQDLETISQLESEELHLELTSWNLQAALKEIIDQFEIKAKQKKIKIVHNKKSTNCNVLADKGKIVQVLSNLISNSIKYGKNGGKTTISCHQTKDQCFITVKDDGIGIAEKNKHRLFERFYRVDKSRSREQGGTGLGLAIVKHILEAHDQTITVKSVISKGTEFTFTLRSIQS